jgi:hypothetical protein
MKDFQDLLQQLTAIPCDEQRKQYEGYLEFVLSDRHLGHLYPILEKYFGVPFKPAGIVPTQKAEDIAKVYGGIRKHQTLYFMDQNGLASCAMIWPWNDGKRATVKVAQGVLEGA